MIDATFVISTGCLQEFGLAGEALEPLPGDASSRRYARVTHPTHGPCLVLSDQADTPHFLNFLLIGEHLSAHGFSAPRIFAVSRREGVALIEDFGDASYTRLLSEGFSETALYDLATDTLAALAVAVGASDIAVPTYDLPRLLDEVALFPDWFAPGVGQAPDDHARAEHQALWADALSGISTARDALVLRDFHVDNLLFLKDREGVRQCGLLDFQDGLIGSAAYDLVSLTQDARRDVSPALEQRCLERYLAARPGINPSEFMSAFHLLGAQRHTKVAGIFHRLAKRDGKAHYLTHVPRVLRLMARALDAAKLHDLIAYYDRAIPAWRG